MHGAMREREAGIDGLDISESTLMGSSKDEFARAVAAQKAREERFQHQKASRGSGLLVGLSLVCARVL